MPRDLGALSGPLAGVTFLGGVGGAIRIADTPFPRPGSTAEQIRTYFQGSARAARFSQAGQLISSASLARFTVSVARLAARSGPGAKGRRAAAIAGGALAASSLAASSLTSARLTRGAHDDDTTHRLARRAFALGGPVHGVGFGVLTAALALSGRGAGELPEPAVRAGLGAAAAGVLSPLYFAWEPAGWLIPLGRFPGLILAGDAGVRLSRGRS